MPPPGAHIMTLRHTSIRTRIFLLVLVPLLALILVYGYAIAGQVSTAVGLANAGKISGTTITPVTDTMTALNAERTSAVQYLASRSPQAAAAFQQDEAASDKQFRIVKTVTSSGPVVSNATALDKADAAAFVRDDNGRLQTLRSEVLSNSIGRTAAINAYSAIMTDGQRVAEQSLQENYVSQPLAITARAEASLFEAEMVALEENAIYSGDVATGQMPTADQKEFAQLAGLRQYLVADAMPQLDGEAAGLLHQEVPASLSAALTSEENAIISAPAGAAKPAVSLSQWEGTLVPYATHLEVVLTKSPVWIQSQVTSQARRALTTLIVVASLGLLLVIASIAFSLLMGRRLMRRLNSLRQAALELAHDRLPRVMTRLRDGETVDVEAEAPPVEQGADEIDQVREAFNTVHRTAVAAAVDETNLRRGINEVFRNLARRNQVLLHRQLGLLDGMERKAEEPDQLEDLFRIDHLTTRMRRHAEGLIVLAGDSPGRGWRHPVRFVDVLRAAVAEIEDYARVRVEVHSRAALTGPAVADVVHLLAELIENAAVYSPPTTVVRVQGELVGRGFCIEVEDRGLGMADEQLAEINHKLAAVPAFDLSGSDRLGLFVAGRLAHRHGISIALRSSVYGGTTAVVIIPTSLVVTDEGQVPAVTSTRYALHNDTPVPALSGANGHGSNGPALKLNGNGSNGHLSNGHGANGHAGNGSTRSLTDFNGHAAGDDASPDRAGTESALAADGAGIDPLGLPPVTGTGAPAAPSPAISDDSGWWLRPTLASNRKAESIRAGQAIGSATEVVPESDGNRAAKAVDNGGLPVRVRQASLAPQLREGDASGETPETAAGPGGRPPGTPADSTASAEAVRSTMSAMQRGWELGRSVAADSPAGPPSAAPPTAAPPVARGGDSPEPPQTPDEAASREPSSRKYRARHEEG
jgi:signal transduction histidine kinase